MDYFEPQSASAHDAGVVQVGLNAPGGIAASWAVMRLTLAAIVGPDHLAATWGHSLIFQALLAPNAGIDEAENEALMAVRQDGEFAGWSSVKHADLAGSHFSLLNLPVRGDGWARATAYLALCPASAERALMQAILGPRSNLLIPDLIIHKGLAQRHHYFQQPIEAFYRDKIVELRNATDQLLANLGRTVAGTDEIDELARSYGVVAALAPTFHQYWVSLQQQLHNFEHWCQEFGRNPILDFQREHLETAVAELRFKLDEVRDALEGARAAADLAQIRMDRNQNQQQQQIQTLLTVFGVGLAVAQVVDRDAAGEILRVLLRPFSLELPSDSLGFWLELAVQIAVITLTAYLAAKAVDWWSRQWGDDDQREGIRKMTRSGRR